MYTVSAVKQDGTNWHIIRQLMQELTICDSCNKQHGVINSVTLLFIGC